MYAFTEHHMVDFPEQNDTHPCGDSSMSFQPLLSSIMTFLSKKCAVVVAATHRPTRSLSALITEVLISIQYPFLCVGVQKFLRQTGNR